MNPNAHRKDSGSHINNGYSDPGSYPNQFNKMNGMQAQQQPWSPQSPAFPHPFAPSGPRMQNNGWPQHQQQHQQSMPQIQIPNGGMPAAVPTMQPHVSPINTMGSNNTNSLGLLPANILQDVFRLSVPVGTSPNDDTLLVQVLKESTQRGQTYKQAIETLHGINNHSANLWKDYYLDHKTRLDNTISPAVASQTAVPPVEHAPKVRTVKKPSPYVPPPAPPKPKDVNASASSSSSRAPLPRRVVVKKERVSPKPFSPAPPPPAKAASKRRTINSITAHEPTLNLKLLPPQADIKLPDPPSRPPTPPTRIIRGVNGGNRYTPEDKEFFIKSIHWELENNPELTKHDLCVLLSQKVPSHSVDSWKSYWSNAHELPDKIYASYDRVSEEEARPKASVSAPVVKGRPKYVEESESESGSEASSASGVNSVTDSDYDALEELLAADSDDEGGAGGPYTATDMKNLVVFLAEHPPNEKESVLWAKFHGQHPQRSDKSWREYHRRNEKELSKHVRKYRRRERAKKNASLPAQHGRPSWASTNGPLPSALKRKVSTVNYDGKFSKRAKDDGAMEESN